MIATVLLLTVSGLSVTPVQKVIQMMEEMKAKGEKEMEDEQKTWENYADWCKDTSVEKDQNIRTATADIERLQATIQKHEAEAAALADAIAALDQDIATWQSELEKATELRSKERADFEVMQQDYSESVDALARAIAVLKAKSADVPQALLEVANKGKGYVQPEADAYEFQSGGVVDMLEKLQDKFREELNTLESDEKQAQHNYDMAALQLNDSIKFATKQRDEKMGKKAEHESAAAEAKGELTDVQAAKAADEKYLKELISQCDLKKASFEERQKLRKEELEVLAEAISIIASKSVSGAADKHLPSLVQKRHSFGLLRATSTFTRVTRAAELLQKRGQALKSSTLSMLAVRAKTDPMAKVVTMIKELIARLQQEAAEEADHKAWCDGELKTNKLTREEKTREVDELQAKVDETSAAIEKLKEEQAELNAAIAEIDRAMLEATEIRTKEKAKNEETIADAEAAIEAVKSALAILKEFYAKAATATALTQQKQSPAEEAPESWDEPYQGQGGSSKGVVGMLEVIQTDFNRLLADTTADENSAQREYDAFAETSAADKKAKHEEAFAKSLVQIKKEHALVEIQEDLKSAQGELDAALAYYDELKPACLEAGVSYEERVKRREEEIASLNEAWKILNGDA